MEKMIPAAMTEALKRMRPEINSMYEYWRSVNREPDPEDVLDLFLKSAAPLYEKETDVADDILCGMFGEALELSGRGFLGRRGRFSMLECHLMRIIHFHDVLLSSQKNFMTMVFNALYNIHVSNEGKVRQWADAMCSGWKPGNAASFRKPGFLLAWRSGMARFRDEALEIAGAMDDDLLDKFFSTGDVPGREAVRRMKDDPWFNPARAVNEGPVFLHTGGYRGAGGLFVSLPDVRTSGGVIYAGDNASVFRIYADAFGVEAVHDVELTPGSMGVGDTGNVKFRDGRFSTGGDEFPLPEFCSGEVMSLAAAGNTVAWTMKNSYKIYIAGISRHA